MAGDQLVQRVLEQVTFELEMIKGEYKEWLQPFNLSKVPLMRAGLKELKDNSYLLVIDLHHIITDGVSLSIFMNDFKALYAGKHCRKIVCNIKIMLRGNKIIIF